MPGRVESLSEFFVAMAELIELIEQCSRVLYRVGFRENLGTVMPPAAAHLREFATNEWVLQPDAYPGMLEAGLYGDQLRVKLESFNYERQALHSEAGAENLYKALDVGNVILRSAAGAIPGLGSFVEELVDFLLKELRKRFRWRR
jgi:hypothetical protein